MNFAKNLFGQVMVNYQTHKHTRSTFPSDDRGAAEKFQLWSILLGKEETTPLLFPYGQTTAPAYVNIRCIRKDQR